MRIRTLPFDAMLRAAYVTAIAISAVLLVIASLWWVRSAWRAAGGHCAGCGYDLRGVDGACPECGKPQTRLEPHRSNGR